MQIIVNYLLTVAQAFGLVGDPGTGTVRAFRGACYCFARLVGERIDELDRPLFRLPGGEESKTPASTEY